MQAMEIVVKPHKTLRFNLAICKPFNADFDGKISLLSIGDLKRVQSSSE